jgi:hypothetical protein
MKTILLPILILTVSGDIIAQQWQIEDTELKAQKKNGEITVSRADDSKSLTFPADSVYRFEQYGFLIVKSGNKFGMLDPWDFEWIQQPVFTSLNVIYDGNIIVGEKGKYGILTLNELFKKPPDFFYDTLFSLTPPGEPVYNDWHYYITRNKKKYGLLLETSWDPIYEFIQCTYDEIQLLKTHADGIVYKFRQGKKWGAGDCEGIEVTPEYAVIEYLTGACQNNVFLVKKDNKYSIFCTGDGERYPFIFDNIQFIPGKQSKGYFILESEGKFDVNEYIDCFEMPSFEGRYDNIGIEDKNGSYVIIMERNGEKTSLNVQ